MSIAFAERTTWWKECHSWKWRAIRYSFRVMSLRMMDVVVYFDIRIISPISMGQKITPRTRNSDFHLQSLLFSNKHVVSIQLPALFGQFFSTINWDEYTQSLHNWIWKQVNWNEWKLNSDRNTITKITVDNSLVENLYFQYLLMFILMFRIFMIPIGIVNIYIIDLRATIRSFPLLNRRDQSWDVIRNVKKFCCIG